MKTFLLRLGFVVAALATVVLLDRLARNAEAADVYQSHPTGNDLFYNYYVNGSGVPAQLYVSPRPVPEHVGQTYITYQPLMPHEFMYKHHRHYYSHPAGGGWTHTKVSYGHRLLPHWGFSPLKRTVYPRPMPAIYDPGWSH